MMLTPFKSAAILALAGIATGIAAVPASAQYTYITDFTKNGNMQSNLDTAFPGDGIFTANDSYATPFDITSDSSGNNFAQMYFTGNAPDATDTINTNIFGVTHLYTLLNAYYPGGQGDPAVDVTFTGSAGAVQTVTLNYGEQVRDFYDGIYTDDLTDPSTENALNVYSDNSAGGSGGAAGTGDPVTDTPGTSGTGDIGYYYIDEQNITLDAAFATQTLTSITFTNDNVSGTTTPLLMGMTAQSGSTAPTPEASSAVSAGLLLAMGGLAVGARRRRASRSSN